MQRTARSEIGELLEQLDDPSAAVRAQTLKSLCPCHVKRNESCVWDRVFLLLDDLSPKVRSLAFHTLADGSPREREGQVVEAIERLQLDPDVKLRRRARKLLAHYRRINTDNNERIAINARMMDPDDVVDIPIRLNDARSTA